MKDRNYISVKWLKPHFRYSYIAGDIGSVHVSTVADLLNGGYILPLPELEEEKNNPLPEDLPGRDNLFNAGFTTLDQVKDGGDSLLDAGISVTTLKKIKSYFKK